jgi:DMSO/TMAO reductase YedYZ molybdopterin-dependent catalytic subunit
VLRGLVGSGLTVAACLGLGAYDAWAGALGSLLGRGEVARTLFPFTPPRPRAPGFPVAGMEPEVTPAAHFYLLSKNDVDPVVEPSSWYLRVTGAVDRPIELSYADLTGMPRADEYLTLRCVNNPPGGHLMSTAYWSGVPLATLLTHAGAHANAVAVKLHAPDGYDEIVPLAAAMGPGALLAYGMNGETLPRRHGGPARALIPGYFGFKNVKWVEAITVLTSVEQGYWARRGWTAEQIHSVARIDTSRRTANGMLVAGVAFGGASGVSAVQARVDDGPWQSAILNTPPLSTMSWVQWRVELPMGAGSHTITARMVDGQGAPQIETSSNPQPGGATGLDSVRVEV